MKVMMLFVLGLVVFLVSMSFVSAGCINSNQTIMRLSGAGNNAHAALWNETSYYTKICYDDYFEEAYDDAGDVHNCTNNNRILGLYAPNNSHVSENGTAGYVIDICHKGLSNCYIEKGGCSTGRSGYISTIVYLTNFTNAHVSKTPGLRYNYSLCCEGKSKKRLVPSIGVSAPSCSQLDKDSCENSGDIAREDVGCNEANRDCYCVWNSTNSHCNVAWSIRNYNNTNCDYTCVISGSDRTECTGGSKIISLDASLTPITKGANCLATFIPECKSDSATVPCGDLGTALPFFGIWQFAISLISILAVYAIFGRRLR